MKKDDCIFCKIANGEIPSNTLYEDDSFRVILDLGPATKGHALVMPKEHFGNLYELPDDWCQKAFSLAKKMAGQMTEKLHCDGFNLVQNNGATAGQTVPHFHIHLIPRYENDGQTINWKQTSPTAEELAAVKEEILGYDRRTFILANIRKKRCAFDVSGVWKLPFLKGKAVSCRIVHLHSAFYSCSVRYLV